MSIDTRPKSGTRVGLSRLRRGLPARNPESSDPLEAVGRLPEAPRMAGRRNPRWIALGIVALCLGGLLSYVIYTQVAAQSAVVAMAHTVHRGAVVKPSALTTTPLSGN